MSFSVAFVGVLGEAQGYAAPVQERPVDRPAVPPSDIVDDAMAAEMADYYGWPIDQAEERVAEQNAIVDFKASLPQSVREAWAGGVVDQEGGGGRRWFVATTEAKAELEDAAQSLALSGDTSLSVELVDHSLQDLEAAALDVAMSLSEAGAVVTQISVEVEDNGLAVGVPASDAVLEAQLTSPIAPDSAVESASQNRQTVEATILEAAQVNGVSIEVSEAREPRLDVEMSCTPGPYVFNVATTLHCDDPLRGVQPYSEIARSVAVVVFVRWIPGQKRTRRPRFVPPYRRPLR